jgi:hypothetical protein
VIPSSTTTTLHLTIQPHFIQSSNPLLISTFHYYRPPYNSPLTLYMILQPCTYLHVRALTGPTPPLDLLSRRAKVLPKKAEENKPPRPKHESPPTPLRFHSPKGPFADTAWRDYRTAVSSDTQRRSEYNTRRGIRAWHRGGDRPILPVTGLVTPTVAS